MVAESSKMREQRLNNEINNLKKEKEELNLIITEKNKDISVLKANLDVNNKVLEHNQTQINQIVSERNKIEKELNELTKLYNNITNELAKIRPIYFELKKLSLFSRIFNYKKHFPKTIQK